MGVRPMGLQFEQFLSARSAFGPTVDADGTRLYFLADLTGASALWSLPLGEPGAWPEPYVTRLDRVQQAFPGPKPGQVVVAADVGGDERTQLLLLGATGTSPRPLTHDPATIHLFGGWHPHGRTISFSTNARDPRHFDVELLDIVTGERRMLWSPDASCYADQFSPDGRSLLVRRLDSHFDQTVFLLDLQTGAIARLTPGGTPAVYESLCFADGGRRVLAVSDVGREFRALVAIDVGTGLIEPLMAAPHDVDAFSLAPSGTHGIYALNTGGASEVHLLDLQSGADRTVELPLGQVYDGYRWQPTFSWLPDSSSAFFALGDARATPDIFQVEVASATVGRVTRSWRAGIDPELLAPARIDSFPTFDGRQIPTLVLEPPGAPRDGTAPALFYVHGGPESQTRVAYNPIVQFLAHRGFTVIAPNVRGSSGYGREYLAADDVERRMDSVRDLAAGVAWAVESNLAHPKRIAVMGGSYGGFMVLSALTEYPDLWAAGVDIVGIANFVTFLEQTGPWRRHLREAEYGSLANHRELLESISPIHKVDRIRAPLFVVHGANDPRVPIGEAEQIVGRLRDLGRPVEYLRYEDEGHGLAKLGNRLDAYPKIAAFLERHLGVTGA